MTTSFIEFILYYACVVYEDMELIRLNVDIATTTAGCSGSCCLNVVTIPTIEGHSWLSDSLGIAIRVERKGVLQVLYSGTSAFFPKLTLPLRSKAADGFPTTALPENNYWLYWLGTSCKWLGWKNLVSCKMGDWLTELRTFSSKILSLGNCCTGWHWANMISD